MAKTPNPVTIYDLECTAKEAKDGLAYYKIHGAILEVYWDDANDIFDYRWGKNDVPRQVAINVLATA